MLCVRLGTEARAEAACLHPVLHLGMGADSESAVLLRRAEEDARREVGLVRSLGGEAEVGEVGSEIGGVDGLNEGSGVSEVVRPLRMRLAQHERRAALLDSASECTRRADECTADEFAEQTARMMAVLRKLGHVDDENLLSLKGRAACEVCVRRRTLILRPSPTP